MAKRPYPYDIEARREAFERRYFAGDRRLVVEAAEGNFLPLLIHIGRSTLRELPLDDDLVADLEWLFEKKLAAGKRGKRAKLTDPVILANYRIAEEVVEWQERWFAEHPKRMALPKGATERLVWRKVESYIKDHSYRMTPSDRARLEKELDVVPILRLIPRLRALG